MVVDDTLLEEKRVLLTQGYPQWSRRDYKAYVSACESHGRKNTAAIMKEMLEQTGKTEQEVEEYAAVFWAKIDSLQESARVIDRIERGEARIERVSKIASVLSAKVAKHAPNPLSTLKLNYGAHAKSRHNNFTEENDRFLVVMTEKLGYGNWDELLANCRSHYLFRFDWYEA